jgi:beta-glucanase (GH16 family)
VSRAPTRSLLPLVIALGGCAGGPRPASRPPAPLQAAPTPPLPGLTLAWHDEFDGSALDTTRWTVYEGPRRDAQNTADAVTVANGLLTITTYTDAGEHRTGFIDTARHFLATYGWFEARMRFVSAPGEWGAFWLQSPTMGNPVGDVATAGTEIDIVEHRAVDADGRDIANTYSINLHWDGYGAAHQHAGGDGAPAPGAAPLQGGWHTYAVHWTEEGYVFYLDGVRQWASAQGVSRRPEFIKVTCEVQDRGWAGAIPAGGYGTRGASATRMQVDWVRVWQPAP